MSRMIIVNVFTADSDVITRSPTGAPKIEGHTQQARLYLATSHEGGWLLETWRQDGAEYEAQQQIEMTDTDALAAGVARAVQAIATGKE